MKNYNSNFKVPENYFQDQKAKILRQNRADFNVPEAYFEIQKELLLEQSKSSANQIFSWRKFTGIAAILALFTFLMVYFIQLDSYTPIDQNESYGVLYDIYVEPTSEIQEVEVNLIEDYFGPIAVVENHPTSSKPTVSEKPIPNKVRVAKEMKEEATVEKVDEVLYELYIDEETSSEEEVSDDDYFL